VTGVALPACCCAASRAAEPRKAFAHAVRAKAIVAGTPASFDAWLRDELAACATPPASRAPDLGSQLAAIAGELLPRMQSLR
jgi:hypothetical protein